jgi:hypothetical protein
MPPITLAKIVLAIVGVLLFMSGNRSGNDLLRWVGIGLLIVGFLLRFVKRPPPPSPPPPPTE